MNKIELQKTEAALKEKEAECRRLYNKARRIRQAHKLTVTDHAIVRYQERVELLPPAEVEHRLLTPKVIRYYTDLGDGIYPIAEGAPTRVVIREGFIVSIYV